MTPSQLLALFHPVPKRGGSLDKKFTWFYKAYDYTVNTQKFMKFEEDPPPEILQEHRAIRPVFGNFKCTPWTDNRPESYVVHNRAVEEFQKDMQDC